MSRLFCVLLSAPLFLFAGCGGDGMAEPVPVSGKIMYQGKPVQDARVTFHWTGGPGGRSATGKTDAQGAFQLTTVSTNDGAVPGEYLVTVQKIDPAVAQADTSYDPETGEVGADYGRMMMEAASGRPKKASNSTGVPPKYASAAESDIRRSIVAGQNNDFTIDLE
jgi:hypothetical protein